MTKSLNWKIDKKNLIGYKSRGWTEDYFISSPNSKYGIIIYNIEEWRMGVYGGLIGIYSNFESPILELNSNRIWIYFQNDKTFNFLEKSECIVCRISAYNPNSIKGGFPFLIFNLKNKRFTFFEFDETSIYYGLEEIQKNKAKLIEIRPKDLEYINREKRTDEIVDLEELKWFDFIDFYRALEKYFE